MREISGVFAATVTPFDPASGLVDHDWIRSHLAYLRRHHCDGVVPLGTNGEGVSLSVEERKAVIETVLDAAGGMRVVPGTGCASLPDTIELTRFALNAGADAALVIPPFYFKNVSDEGVLIYYQRLCDAAIQPGQQLFLYHFPKMSAVPIAESVVKRLQESHPGCVGGLKDSSGELASVRRWVDHYPHLRVFAGSDTLSSDAYRTGVAGTMTAGANIIPHLIQAVRSAVRAGQDPTLLQERINAVRRLLGRFPMRAATKYLVSRLAELPRAAVRPPLIDLDAAQEEELNILAAQMDFS